MRGVEQGRKKSRRLCSQFGESADMPHNDASQYERG
jgi:hypothetical protein